MKRTSLRLSDELHEQAAAAASEDQRSLNFVITAALQDFLRNRARRLATTKEQP